MQFGSYRFEHKLHGKRPCASKGIITNMALKGLQGFDVGVEFWVFMGAPQEPFCELLPKPDLHVYSTEIYAAVL